MHDNDQCCMTINVLLLRKGRVHGMWPWMLSMQEHEASSARHVTGNKRHVPVSLHVSCASGFA